MKVLIAEDDRVSRGLLIATVTNAGHEVVATEDGEKAWQVLQQPDGPTLAVLDWMMPGIDGVEICRRLRRAGAAEYLYVILLTTKNRQEEVVAGLEAGADDYVTKPYDPTELRSRIRAGQRILELKATLDEKVRKLRDALEHVKQLQGLLPICMHCKSIRDEENTWHRIEAYIAEHADVRFSHGVCQKCLREHYPDLDDVQDTGPASP
jgi:CheY-like chemotaxis protein